MFKIYAHRAYPFHLKRNSADLIRDLANSIGTAFEGLRLSGRKIRRPERTVATPDHNVPTTDRSLPIADPVAALQVDTLRNNCAEFGVKLYDIDS